MADFKDAADVKFFPPGIPLIAEGSTLAMIDCRAGPTIFGSAGLPLDYAIELARSGAAHQSLAL